MLVQLVDDAGGEAEVAARLCKVTRRQSRTDFDTARRNLANWAAGRTRPQRRSFATLTQALRLDNDPVALARWRQLYASRQADSGGTGAEAVADAAVSSAQVPATPADATRVARPQGRRWPLAAVLTLPAIAVALLFYLTLAPAQDDARTIGYLPYAELKVGESVLMHAKRGECGAPPPEWWQMEHEIPILKTGRLVDDGLGISRSVTCGVTPGRLVRFVAEHPGDEIFELFDRRLRVVVSP